jgi:hypothetical protein
MPFGILEPASHLADGPDEVRRYTVVIPYEDPELTRLAPSVMRDRMFAQFERDIDAKTQSEAKKLALEQFAASDASDRYRGNRRDGVEKVNVKASRVLVIDQQSAAPGTRR